MGRPPDHAWKRRFSSSTESLLEGFYKPALMDAVRYWRSSTGYFTSRALLQVLDGVTQLVAATPHGRGHGQMRLITGFSSAGRTVPPLPTARQWSSYWATTWCGRSRSGMWSRRARTRTLWGLSCWPGWWITATWRSGWPCPSTRGRGPMMGPSSTPRKASLKTALASAWLSAAASMKPPTAGAATTSPSPRSAPGGPVVRRTLTRWKPAF